MLHRLLLQLRSPADTHQSVSAGGRHETYPEPGYRVHDGLYHMTQPQLDYIVRQVHTEGYHVEHISSFRVGDIDTGTLISAIKDWAASVNLIAGFNHPHDLCVFEQA
jgi:Zn-dependent M16 (insulinase) family peptidase